MVLCFVPDCNHYSDKENNGCKMFRFPDKYKNPERRKLWLKLIRYVICIYELIVFCLYLLCFLGEVTEAQVITPEYVAAISKMEIKETYLKYSREMKLKDHFFCRRKQKGKLSQKKSEFFKNSISVHIIAAIFNSVYLIFLQGNFEKQKQFCCRKKCIHC